MACWMFQVFKRLAGFISWVLAANLRGLARLYFEDMLTDFHYLKKFWRNESCPTTVWLLHWLWISYFNREILLNAFGHDFKSHLPDAFPFLMAQLCLQTLKSRLACDVMFKVASCVLRAILHSQVSYQRLVLGKNTTFKLMNELTYNFDSFHKLYLYHTTSFFSKTDEVISPADAVFRYFDILAIQAKSVMS